MCRQTDRFRYIDVTPQVGWLNVRTSLEPVPPPPALSSLPMRPCPPIPALYLRNRRRCLRQGYRRRPTR
ncbi:unnamed protein product [Leptidea sinapis]|uniref:Uncharacterized protein n=1 Tax=Leptidea sinapis TaxID=189913 RepID=A0A5E4R2I0_9NEOP|nr:unnamed protein product [Leptidea sinapis]